MFISIFLGKVLGLYYLIVSGLYLFRKDELKSVMNEIYKSRALQIYNGIIALIVGLLIVIGHNVWVLDWRILITLTGYIALAKGISLLYFPEKIESFSRKFLESNNLIVSGVIVAAIGLLLIFMSFFAY